MKKNTITNPNRRRGVLAAIATVALAVACTGIGFAYSFLRDLWHEQCVIADLATQVRINDGRMVRADVITREFGLRNGANLALIDFAEKRRATLKKIPNLRNIVVRRRLPDGLEIEIEERSACVRVGVKGSRTSSNRVADSEGVVFSCALASTGLLPVIREPASQTTRIGNVLGTRSLAALRLIEICGEKFTDLGVREADVSNSDYILLTLGDYSRAKVAWEGMDNPSPSNTANLIKQLRHLSQAIASRVGAGVRVWNATQDGHIFADTQKGFL